jgi:lysophospholipase L1-like esterase
VGQEQRIPRVARTGSSRIVAAILILLAAPAAAQDVRPTSASATAPRTVYCLGDSNTDVGRKRTDKWCEHTARAFPDWRFVNGGFARTKAAGDCLLCGRPLLTSALRSAAYDIVIIALGTNDRTQPPESAVAALLALRDQAEQAHARVLIATIPPAFDGYGDPTWVERANALLTARAAPTPLIDFVSGMQREDYYPDGVHILESGQQKRARAAISALRALSHR